MGKTNGGQPAQMAILSFLRSVDLTSSACPVARSLFAPTKTHLAPYFVRTIGHIRNRKDLGARRRMRQITIHFYLYFHILSYHSTIRFFAIPIPITYSECSFLYCTNRFYPFLYCTNRFSEAETNGIVGYKDKVVTKNARITWTNVIVRDVVTNCSNCGGSETFDLIDVKPGSLEPKSESNDIRLSHCTLKHRTFIPCTPKDCTSIVLIK